MKDLTKITDEAIAKAKAAVAKEKTFASEQKEVSTKSDKEQLSAFFKALSTRDSASLASISKDIAMERKEQNVGTVGDGGYLVPTTLDAMVRKKLYAISPMRQISTVISNMPAKLDMPTENALPTTYWVAEAAAITESKATFGKSTLEPHKLAGLDSFTSEVLADAAINENVQNYVIDRFATALALAEVTAFTNGDGTDRPYGFRDAVITPNTVAQVGATAGTLDADDIKALFYTLPQQYRDQAVFVMHDSARQLVDGLKDSNGRYLWQDSIAAGTGSTLLGRPVVFNNDIPTNLGAGAETEIWFYVPTNYIIGDRGGLRVDTGTNADDFAKDKVSLRMIQRVAGIPVHGESFASLTAVQ